MKAVEAAEEAVRRNRGSRGSKEPEPAAKSSKRMTRAQVREFIQSPVMKTRMQKQGCLLRVMMLCRRQGRPLNWRIQRLMRRGRPQEGTLQTTRPLLTWRMMTQPRLLTRTMRLRRRRSSCCRSAPSPLSYLPLPSLFSTGFPAVKTLVLFPIIFMACDVGCTKCILPASLPYVSCAFMCLR